jgi:hypothetical protein
MASTAALGLDLVRLAGKNHVAGWRQARPLLALEPFKIGPARLPVSAALGPVYQLTPPSSPGQQWPEAVLASFGTSDMCRPDSPLILRNGNLYGTSCLTNGGVVFELQPPASPGGPWTNTPLCTCTNAQIPTGAMVMTKGGTIYGVTNNPSCCQAPGGTLYQLTTQ